MARTQEIISLPKAGVWPAQDVTVVLVNGHFESDDYPEDVAVFGIAPDRRVYKANNSGALIMFRLAKLGIFKAVFYRACFGHTEYYLN